MSDELETTGGWPGGSGPISVTTEVIAARATSFTASAGRTGAVGAELASLASDPALILAAALDPVGAVRVQGAVATAGLGPNGLAGSMGLLAAHATKLGVAAGKYEVTEGKVGSEIDRLKAQVDNALVSTISIPILGQVSAGVLEARNLAGELDDTVKDMWRGKPINEAIWENLGKDLLGKEAEIVASALPFFAGFPPTAQNAAKKINTLLNIVDLVRSERELVVTKKVTDSPVSMGAGLAGVVVGLDAVNDAQSGDDVSVTKISSPGQPDRYVLSCAGTVNWFDPKHPFDLKSNVQLKGGYPSDAERVARTALDSIPPGSEVMLTGYSQGGMVAAKLAGDPRVHERFKVRGLLTVGSPTADVIGRVPKGVKSLSVEHTDDPVPTMDGRRVIPNEDRYVARVDSPDIPVDSALKPHSYSLYRNTLDRVDASGDLSARSYRESMADFQSGPGTTATINEWTGERKEKP